MIDFSSEVIEYSQDQTIQTLIVTNKAQVQILFKVRTNNVKAIDARPNTGSLTRGANTKIIIKRNQGLSDNVKLQFTYLFCNQPLNKDNFKQLWAKFEKDQQSKTFPIKVENNKIQQKKDKVVSQSDPNMFQSVRMSRISTTSQQAQKQERSSQEVKKQKQKEQTTNSSKLQRKIEEKKFENKALSKKLSQTQENIDKNKQLQVQKYLNAPKCKRRHISSTLLGIIAALFLVLGYYLGHSNSHSHDHDHDSSLQEREENKSESVPDPEG